MFYELFDVTKVINKLIADYTKSVLFSSKSVPKVHQ